MPVASRRTHRRYGSLPYMPGPPGFLTWVRWGEGGGAPRGYRARLRSSEIRGTAMSQVTCSAGPRADDITYAEADLVAQLRAGDEAAMAQLVDQWSPVMLRVARSFVYSLQSAEDVVQDAWLGMLSGLAAFEGRSSLRAWTFTILVNRARTRGAREARTLPRSPLASHDEAGAGDWLAGPEGEPAWTWF